jgi:hypothetical protein
MMLGPVCLTVVCVWQQYQSMSKRNPFVRDVYTCLYQFKCRCYCALSVKTFAPPKFADKVEVALAGELSAIPAAVVFCP